MTIAGTLGLLLLSMLTEVGVRWAPFPRRPVAIHPVSGGGLLGAGLLFYNYALTKIEAHRRQSGFIGAGVAVVLGVFMLGEVVAVHTILGGLLILASLLLTQRS